MKKEIIYFLILFLLIATTKVFFDYRETKVLLWKENVIEAFALAIIITFINWLLSPRSKQKEKPTKDNEQ